MRSWPHATGLQLGDRRAIERIDASRVPDFRSRMKGAVFGVMAWAAHLQLAWAVTGFDDIEITANILYSARLPPRLFGFRILHLSDLHLESLPSISRLVKRLEPLDFQTCVITGDIASGPQAEALAAEMGRWISSRCHGYAVLGNHDLSGLVPALRQAGLSVLLNEALPLHGSEGTVWVAGVDDPYYYRTADLRAAVRAIPSGAITLLLAHSPQLAEEAASAGCTWYLCGHTHGGHIRRRPPAVAGGPSPSGRHSGTWAAGPVLGYTSRGIGGFGAIPRVNCPPEITVHVLRGTDAKSLR